MSPIELLAHPYTVALMRWSLAGVLLLSGVGKLFDRAGFVRAVASYRILPAPLARVFAVCLPYGEIALGCALFVGAWTNAMAALVIVLFLCFAIAIAVNLARGNKLDCHCFGALQRETIGPASLLRVLLLALLAMLVMIFADGYLAVDRWLPGARAVGGQGPPTEGLLALVLAVVVTGLIGLLLQQLWKIARLEIQ